MASCLESFLRVPGGSLSNASSVGAKMVTALAFFRVSTRSKSLTSFTKVLKPGVDAAVSTTSKNREIILQQSCICSRSDLILSSQIRSGLCVSFKKSSDQSSCLNLNLSFDLKLTSDH